MKHTISTDTTIDYRLIRYALLKGNAEILIDGDSMYPLLPRGRRVRMVDATDKGYQVGDIIFFKCRNVLMVHRIIGFSYDEKILDTSLPKGIMLIV